MYHLYLRLLHEHYLDMHKLLTEGGEDKCSMFLFDWIATAFSTTINDNETRDWIWDQMVILGEWILIKVAIAISKMIQIK